MHLSKWHSSIRSVLRGGILFLMLTTCQLTQKILSAEAYDSTYVLTIKQKFAIPENVANGDQVGYWKKTVTWRSGNTVTYQIRTNYQLAFSINATSGLITVSNATKINGKIVRKDTIINLIIRTTDSGIGYEDDTCQIQVKEAQYCKFIDYNYTGTQAGTKTQPYSDLSSTTVTAGYAYFFKRGNTPANKKYNISGIQATETSPTIIGAYGVGANPAFNGSGLTASDGLFYFLNTPLPSEYIKIYNIDIKNYPSSALRIATRSRGFGVYNSVYNNNVRLSADAGVADVYLYGSDVDSLVNWKHELINLESSGSWGPILKTDASGVYAYNIKSSTANKVPAKSFNFRFAISYYSQLSHFVFTGGYRSLQTRYPQVTITDGIITGSGEAGMFLVTDQIGKPDKLKITNVLFRGNDYGIYVYNSNINNTIIQNCRFESNVYDGICFRNGGVNRTIQNCSFINNGNDGIEFVNTSQINTTHNVYYNTFCGNAGKAINAANTACANNLKIYNNTIIGTVDLTGVTGGILRNNFYESTTGPGTISNNVLLSSIVQTSYFRNPALKDYALKSTATNAINKGYDVGLVYDCIKTPISGLPDIGAYEYTTTATSLVNQPPSLNNQDFKIFNDENPEYYVGKVVASDIDSGQNLSYAIVSGNEDDIFTIDPETGVLQTTTGNVFISDSTSFQFVVQVIDNGIAPAINTAAIHVSFLNKPSNLAPVIGNQLFQIQEKEFSNNFIGKIIASDPDSGQQIIYSIIDGNTSNLFKINSQTGELTTTTSNVFSPKDSSYVLKIQVTDNKAKSTVANVTVNFLAQNTSIPLNVFDNTSNLAKSLKVYPNPSKGIVNVEINLDNSGLNSEANYFEKSSIEVIDISGKVIYSKPVDSSELLVQENMDLTKAANGLYFIQLKMVDTVYSKKLILNR